ncbi:MAG: hypothetical protein ACXWQO_12760 [Bdellovibrionota bacterium]
MKTLALALFLFLVPVLFAHAEETVDLQWSVCDATPEKVLKKIDEADAKEKCERISYYDTEYPELALAGVSVRYKKEKGESSVKVRFSQKTKVPDADCEWDRYGRKEQYSCEVTNEPDSSREPWSEEQEEFLGRYYRKADTSALVAYGPFTDRKWKFDHEENKVSFDSVDTGYGHLMEFSVKVPRSEANATAREFTAWLKENEISLCEIQEGKTLRLFRAMGILRE